MSAMSGMRARRGTFGRLRRWARRKRGPSCQRWRIGVACFPRLTDALIGRGYKDADILKILGGNFLRVFREVWKS